MLLSNYFRKKKSSKKGFTLVEAMCSVVILAIVFVGVLNAVAFARQMVYADNVRDKASDKGQIIADEMISICTGYDPEDPNAKTSIVAELTDILNNSSDPQFASIGEAEHAATGFKDLSSFNPATDKLIQYTITPVLESTSTNTIGGHTAVSTTEKGWEITVRIYYQAINQNNSWQASQYSAFAPYNYIK